MKRLILILMFFITCFFIYGDLEIIPGSWEFGQIQEGEILEKHIIFTNNASTTVNIQIIPTCDCIMSQPPELTLAPGTSSTVLFVFDSTNEPGEIERMFMINADLKGFERVFYSITGTVISGQAEITEEPESDEEKDLQVVEMDYYYSPNCAICQKFINSTIPGLEKELNISIILNKKDIINDTDMYMEYISRMQSLGEKERAIPVLFLGRKVLQGSGEIDKKLKDEILVYLESKGEEQEVIPVNSGDITISKEMALLPAIGAGLVDGINPCAFATLISLLAALALAGRKRKEILVIGIFFTLSVFVTYYMVGVGAFNAIQGASAFPIVALIIHWVLVAVLVVFAALSLWDFYLIRVGRSKEMVLQLPDTFKKKIQKTIKTRVRSTAIIASSITLGFLVSLFELACTGQVYFPFITVYVLKIKQNAFGYILLLVYNLGFILPLIGVFIITYTGISSKKITKLFQKHMGIVKLLLAALFIALAVYMIFTKGDYMKEDLLYTKEHLWLKEKNGIVTCGITDHAQELLDEINVIELPKPGTGVAKDEILATIESVKSVFDVLSPVNGKVSEINEKLKEKPTLMNSSPYKDGWIVKIVLADPKELESYMTEDQYKSFISE